MSMNAKTRDQDKVISFKQGRDLITKRSKFRIWKDALHHHHAAENFNAIKTRQRLKVLLDLLFPNFFFSRNPENFWSQSFRMRDFQPVGTLLFSKLMTI